MTQRVRITDVSPRDGLQNEPGVIPASDKARLVRALLRAGLDEVEVTSFVSAKWVPQLGDAGEVLCLAADDPRGSTVRSALVPNERGLADFLEHHAAGRVDKLAVFAAASETFSRKNTNGSIGEVIARFSPVIAAAKRIGAPVRGYVSCVIACPFEGPIEPAKVATVAGQLVDAGVDEVDLGDTIGAGTRDTVAEMLDAVFERLGPAWHGVSTGGHGTVTLHLHNTFGRAGECVREALDLGVRSFDGSVAGIGGCPYASTPDRRAPGNIATDTLVRTVHAAGFKTGVDLEALASAAAVARELVAAGGRGPGA
jgi:hydroxymethylglutaryl-CoA lyase